MRRTGTVESVAIPPHMAPREGIADAYHDFLNQGPAVRVDGTPQ
jgi:hypothetical protein